jgi:hypothetical protein
VWGGWEGGGGQAGAGQELLWVLWLGSPPGMHTATRLCLLACRCCFSSIPPEPPW